MAVSTWLFFYGLLNMGVGTWIGYWMTKRRWRNDHPGQLTIMSDSKMYVKGIMYGKHRFIGDIEQIGDFSQRGDLEVTGEIKMATDDIDWSVPIKPYWTKPIYEGQIIDTSMFSHDYPTSMAEIEEMKREEEILRGVDES